ncbi:hypothetical protein DXG01_015542, partial [Tephrocybe rancida]
MMDTSHRAAPFVTKQAHTHLPVVSTVVTDPVITHHGNAHPKLSSTDRNAISNTRIQVILLDTIRQGTVTAIAGMGTWDVSKATVALAASTGARYVVEKPT